MKNKSKIPDWVILIGVVLIIVVFILSVGLINPIKKDESENISEEDREKERLKKFETLNAELDSINIRLKSIEERILDIKRKEKKVLLWGRILVGVVIIVLDILYYAFLAKDDLLTELLRCNSGLVALYSFVAFITYGTPSKFASSLKKGLIKVFHWYHKSVYLEYNNLNNNKTAIIEAINYLKKKDNGSILVETNQN